MGKIALEGLEFFAYHGYSNEEQKVGNRYGIDVVIDTNFELASVNDTLEQTIDYTKVAVIIEEQMKLPSHLLEHVGQRITDNLFATFSSITHIKIKISKYNPPIGHLCQRAFIEIDIDRS